MTLRLVRAGDGDVDAVFALYQRCTAALLAAGIRQWDDRYPNRATAADTVARGDLFHLVDGAGARAGAVTLNALAAPEYAPIPFACEGPALVIHALVIDPLRQGGGLGRAAMDTCEAYAREHGHRCVRLDAYPGNPAAISLYARRGYAVRGEVHFPFKPSGFTRYVVYEKDVRLPDHRSRAGPGRGG